MAKLITVTDLVRSFSDIIGRVYYQRETFDIKKGAFASNNHYCKQISRIHILNFTFKSELIRRTDMQEECYHVLSVKSFIIS